jgi:hypothetical protein
LRDTDDRDEDVVDAPPERWAVRKGRAVAKKLAVLGVAVAMLAFVVSIVAPAGAGNGDEKVTLRLLDKFADDEENVTL